jgi:sphinganine C4-monooxygenase
MKIVPDLTSSQWAALSPVTSYILGTLFFTSLETFNIWEQHRVYPSKEELKRNKVSRAAVITHAVCYHSVTTALALVFVKALPPLTECSDCFGSYAYWRSSVAHYFPISNHDSTRLMVMSWLARLTYLGVRQFIAFFIFDTWLYWTHLFAHRNRWWFKRFHSKHHELYNSFSFGSAYNHPVESLCFDIVASQLASGIPRLTDIEQGVFLSLATVRSCENHCAYKLPYSPFIVIGGWLGYTPEWHNIHHASFGFQFNFATYFPWWDIWMGTAYTGPRKVYDPSKARAEDANSAFPLPDNVDNPITTGLVLDNELSKLRSRKQT